MFILFKKILNSNPNQRSDILVNSESLLLYNDDVLENRNLGINYNATRIEIASFPNYSFYTPSSSLQVSSVLNVIDVTNGSGSGSFCAGNPGVLDIVYMSTTFPLLRANMIVNNSKSELQPYVFNPTYITFAEKLTFQDKKTSSPDECLLLVLKDSQPKRIMTDLEFDDLVTILDPIIIPI